MADRLIRGYLPEDNIRFAVCQAGALCTDAIRRHNADPVAGWLLSEALACASLLSVAVKGTEVLTLRWIYPGPVGTILVDTRDSGAVRGFPQRLQVMDSARTVEEAIGGHGKISAVTSLPNKVLHTGITESVFRDVPRDMAHLLSLSFQLETAMTVGLIMPPREPASVESAVGVLLQPLPDADMNTFDQMRTGLEQDTFRQWLETAPQPLETVLASAVDGRPAEVLAEVEPHFVCGCSRAKVASVLRMLDPAELQDIIEKDGGTEVSCHFCATQYAFDRAELETFLRESSSGHA